MKIISKMAKQVRESINKEPEVKAESNGVGLSTGSTLLNMALSDKPEYGFLAGHYYLLVGDSSAGKTFLSMSCFAEATQNPAFQKHRLVYDNVEDGMLMDVDRLFGPEVARRMEPPAGTIEDPKFSETIQDLYYHIDDLVNKGKPFIYILDSMDGLSSNEELKKFDEQKKAYRSGKDAAGSYGDGKAKQNSQNLRKMLQGLRNTGSILVIICQTRDNITGYGDPKIWSGGKSLRFYATTLIFASLKEAIKKTIRGKERKIGQKVAIQTKKNRITGKLHEIETTIYPSYGIDDIGSCVDFLVSEKWWVKQKDGGKITAPSITGNEPVAREKLIRVCDSRKSEHKQLMREVKKCWAAIDEDSALKRSPRYA